MIAPTVGEPASSPAAWTRIVTVVPAGGRGAGRARSTDRSCPGQPGGGGAAGSSQAVTTARSRRATSRGAVPACSASTRWYRSSAAANRPVAPARRAVAIITHGSSATSPAGSQSSHGEASSARAEPPTSRMRPTAIQSPAQQ